MGSKCEARVVTIDQGNSSAKALVWRGDMPEMSVRLFETSIEGLLPLFEEGEVDGCIYCSVGHTDAKFLESLRRMVDGRLLVLTHSTPLPIGVVYASRETLGNDRVAAAAGAVALHPEEGVLVVDCGTAVTIDVVDASGRFVGGNIAPGLSLRFNSLHDFTEKLPLVEAGSDPGDFGTDTVSAIRCGVEGGMASEIAYSFSRAADVFGCRRILLTGSDAPVLESILSRRGLSVETYANLVGLGLLSVFRHNFGK